MRTRYLVSGLIAAALLSTTAFAQTTTPSTNPPPAAARTDATAPKLASPHWRSSKMIGLVVYNEQNERLGDINEIILDKDGKALGYVVGVGGFLGMGEHDILIEPSKIKFVNEPRRTQTSAANPPAGTRPRRHRPQPRAPTPPPARRALRPRSGIRITRCSAPPRTSSRRCRSSSTAATTNAPIRDRGAGKARQRVPAVSHF